ncbi:MAG: type VI secretion system protein TssA [Pyrinomonadaceae bacterium]|nr:type VI secretion system protein TssA [Pyrinomonadaceae bacterium]
MSEELQKPPVIDLEALLKPISEENPAGEYLRYSGIYDQIAEARRVDENLSQGDWKTELKVADYRQVINLALPALTTQTKDLQIGVWLTEALTKETGFAGLRDSLKLVTGLQEIFWETLHPEIDEGDMESRANAISWLESIPFKLAVQGVRITDGEGYSFLDWEDSKRFDIPENLDTLSSSDQQRYRDLQTQADTERRVTGELWRKAKAATKRRFCEEIYYAIEECWTEFHELNRVIEEKFDRNQMPGLSGLKKALEDVHTQVKILLEEKRLEEPDEVDSVAEEELSDSGSGLIVGAQGSASVSTGAIQSRKEALKRLSDIADFFQKTEPHSPVSYLVARAVKWGNMPLESWLQDVIKDETVLFHLRQTLGFNTDIGDSTGS